MLRGCRSVRSSRRAAPFPRDEQRRGAGGALEYPWDKWTVFLHPAQRQLVERDYNGPARVSGSAGTGKTIVALHRAVHSGAAQPRSARAAHDVFRHAGECPADQAPAFASSRTASWREHRSALHQRDRRRLYELQFGAPNIASDELLRASLAEAAKEIGGHKFSLHFLLTEWDEVVDAWQLDTWEAYRDVRRLGRKTRLPEPQRAVLWSIFDRVRSRLQAEA